DKFAPGNASNIHLIVQYGPRLFVAVSDRIYIMNESFHVLMMIVDNVDETNVHRCVEMNGLSRDRCTNHVLFIHVFNDTEFFTCGTNALRPKCTYWQWDPKESKFEPKRIIDDDTIFLIADEPTNNKPIVNFDSTSNIVVTALRNSRKFHDAIIKVKLHPELKAWRTERYMDSLNGETILHCMHDFGLQLNYRETWGGCTTVTFDEGSTFTEPIMANNDNNINNMAGAKKLLTAEDRDAQINVPMDRRWRLAKDQIHLFIGDEMKEECL
uniref:Uncharacterized protein n=1 Tax=Romanomermis culicivorax TaxID=13658 RepID=A0A915JB49_ROMCU